MAGPVCPLAGQTVLVLRPAGQQDSLVASLEALGAVALHIPMIGILPPASFDALDNALRSLGRYHWLVFTSANGVSRFCMRAKDLGIAINAGLPAEIRVCAIGPATRAEAEKHGMPIHLVPESFVAEGLAAAFAQEGLRGKRVLLPRAAVARDVAPEALRAQGALVDVVDAYRSAMPAGSEAEVLALVESGTAIHWVLFTSASTVKNFLAAGGRPLAEAARTLSIGPATTEAMRKHGLSPAIACEVHSADGIVQAIVQNSA